MFPHGAIAVSLSATFFSLTFAHEHTPSLHTHTRRQSVPTKLPGNWTSLGCYTDGNGRTLNGPTFASGTAMTVESCINFCDTRSAIYAGVEYGQECYCGNIIQQNGVPAPLSNCNMACSGNATQSCGAGNRLNLFWSGKQPPPAPVTVPRVGNWSSLGCYVDNTGVGGRALSVGMPVAAPLTIERCTTACFNGGYRYSGAEYSGECYCGAAIVGGAVAPIGDCNMVCAGNSTQFCGGPNRLNMYNYTGSNLPTGPASAAPVTVGLPTPWKYAACYVDNAHGRVFETEIGAKPTNTIQTCIAACQAKGLTLAGTEFGTECYCGNRLVNGAVTAPVSECNMGCAANSTQACGAANRLSVYTATANVTVLPIPIARNTSLPGRWVYAGCHTDTNTRVLPWQIIDATNNSVSNCLTQCSTYGYTAAGMEYGQECYCGDIADIAANGGRKTAEPECNIQCPGNPLELCGGGLRLQMYTWNGTVNVWKTPANTGRYEFFVPGVVVPLIATLGVNDKVTFLEKAGTGLPNTTGAYELDLTLNRNFTKAYRAMHLKTDVFCSASLILPDKAGRQINIGGWSGESTYGIRFYTPDGSAGVNGTNDWEENYNSIKLQRGRWYPTAAMLPNGSILVVGGQIGSNDLPQPNLEILPTPPGGNTVIELEWLRLTDPWNLYPFIVVLPSGRIFIAYYNEARILDARTFQTFKVLPKIPGAVNSPLGGRTYPLEGSMMVFPHRAPYTDPLRVLLCGGSTGPGPATVLDNCVSIEPEATTPVWTLERMPTPRVLSCMVTLADGSFMILNGAKKGVAGFGLASDPNLNAVHYDPAQPVGQRMSILNSTIVPRMYHSEAILLPDASVLVSGSDPQTPGFAEEMRIERYIPPYLNEGRTPPTFTIATKDWAYAGRYPITVRLFHGTTSTIKISLVAATSSTHGNTMGAKVLFPAFTCSGTTCTITAPPNANIAPPGWHQLFILDGTTPSRGIWVRIGGDPARLGNWPPASVDFHPPGI